MFASRSDLMVRTRPFAWTWIAAASFLLLLALALLLPAPASAQKSRSKTATSKAAVDSVPKAGAEDEGISVRVIEDGKQTVSKRVRTARERASAARGEAIDEADQPDTPDAPEPPEPSDDHSNDLVRFGQDIVIPAEKVIEGSVITLGGSITVYGRVKGDVTAVGGSVSVRDSAVVEGDAVSVGGSTTVSEGAKIKGSNVSVGGWPGRGHVGVLPFLGLMGLGAVTGVITTIIQVLVTLLFAWLCLLLVRERMEAAVARMDSQFGKSVLWGLVAWMAMIVAIPAICIVCAIAMVILVITIIGIPIAILLAFAMVFALVGVVLGAIILMFLGYIDGAMYLGRKVLARRTPARTYKPIWEIAAGLSLILGMKLLGSLFGVLGILFLMPIGIALGIASVVLGLVFMTAGMGGIVLTRFAKNPLAYAGAPSAPAPPTAPGATAAGWYAPPPTVPPSTKPSPEGGSSDAP